MKPLKGLCYVKNESCIDVVTFLYSKDLAPPSKLLFSIVQNHDILFFLGKSSFLYKKDGNLSYSLPAISYRMRTL